MSNGRKKQTPVGTLAIILAVLIAVAVVKITGISDTKTQNSSLSAGDCLLTVHFLDVGQGDSEFIELPNGQCMLIDAAESEYSDDIVSTVEYLGYSEIDYLVATHPHADHIGGMAQVVKSFDIGEIYMPKAVTDTKTYENLLTVISDKNYAINTAVAGKTVYSDSQLEIEFLAPVGSDYNDLNDYCAVVKITYGENSFLFTGDAEELAEGEMMQNDYSSLDCDVLKVGHHGSSSSSSMEFLNAVSPKYAVISCGTGNSYGHPHSEALSRLAKAGAEVYRTDKEGTVTVTCDGKGNFEVSTSK